MYEIKSKNPAKAGPIILPAEKPESSLAKPLLLSSEFVISAIQAPDAGLVALPTMPLINLVETNNRNNNHPVIC